MKHKPTSEEARIIRECAQRSAGYGRVEICPSTKYNIADKSKPEHMNVLFVSNGWDDDVDLADNSFSWKDFTSGVELTAEGRGIFDFYVYGPLGYHKELQTNVTAYYEDSKLSRVEGTCNGIMWERKE